MDAQVPDHDLTTAEQAAYQRAQELPKKGDGAELLVSSIVTTKTAARRLEVSVPTIHRWMLEENGPQPALRLAQTLGWDINALEQWARDNLRGKWRGTTRVGRKQTAEHGSRSRYVRGCRCDPCKKANAEWQRKYVARKKLEGKE